MARYPRVRVQLVATDRRVVLIDEDIDPGLTDADNTALLQGNAPKLLRINT